MKKFFFNTLSTLFASIILMVIMFFSAISIHSGQFPPTLALAREYSNNMMRAKENYTALLKKSENFLKNELDDKVGPASLTTAADAADIDEMNTYLKQIKTQLNRIEQQNAEILKSLKK